MGTGADEERGDGLSGVSAWGGEELDQVAAEAVAHYETLADEESAGAVLCVEVGPGARRKSDLPERESEVEGGDVVILGHVCVG